MFVVDPCTYLLSNTPRIYIYTAYKDTQRTISGRQRPTLTAAFVFAVLVGCTLRHLFSHINSLCDERVAIAVMLGSHKLISDRPPVRLSTLQIAAAISQTAHDSFMSNVLAISRIEFFGVDGTNHFFVQMTRVKVNFFSWFPAGQFTCSALPITRRALCYVSLAHSSYLSIQLPWSLFNCPPLNGSKMVC